jgi:hypothetical protein
MLKFITFLIFVPVLFSIFTSKPFNFEAAKVKTFLTTPTPPKNTPPEVKNINLSKTKIFLPCAPGARGPDFCTDDFIVDVHAEGFDADNDVFVYEYTVSVGKIIGQGARVKWDLSGVKVGTYELRVEVDDGCGFCGESKNISVEVKECDGCHDDCVCPTMSLTGSRSTDAPKQLLIFTANVSGGSQNEVTYEWSVSNGRIAKGQGTPTVEITPKNPNETVTATVKIGGICEECLNSMSETWSP